jgi:hypothetical protein
MKGVDSGRMVVAVGEGVLSEGGGGDRNSKYLWLALLLLPPPHDSVEGLSTFIMNHDTSKLPVAKTAPRQKLLAESILSTMRT